MIRKSTLFTLLALLFLLCWYALSSKNRFILPNPVDVVQAASNHWLLISKHAFVTFSEMALSIVLSLSMAIPLALIMYSLPNIGGFIQGLFLLLKAFPSFALSPLIVFWVGFGKAAILIPATIMLLFPLTIGLYRGLHAAPQSMVDMFRCWRASKFQIFTYVQIPYALPQFFSGLRIALGLVGTAVLAGEWVGSEEGLGYLLLEAKEGLNIPLAYASLVVLFCFSLLFYLVGICIEKGILHRLKLGSIAQILIASFLLVSCSQQSDKPYTLMLDWTPCPNHIPLIYGESQGYFEERGIPLQIRTPGSHDPLIAVSSGQISACVSHLQRVFRAIDQGADLVVIGVLVDSTLNGLLIQGEKTVSDLNGSRIGVVSKSASKTCQALFARAGIIPSSWVTLRSDSLTALISNQVDAVWGVYPNIEQVQLASLGHKTTYMSVSEFGYPKKSYELVIVAQRGSALHKQAEAFQKALQASINESVAHPQEAFEVYLNRFEEKRGNTVDWERVSWDKTRPLLTHTQEIDPEAYNALHLWLQDAGIISRK